MSFHFNYIYVFISIFLVIIFLISYYYLYFLRKPNRFPPLDENVFVSPANGKIISILNSRDQKYVEIYKNNHKVLDSFVKDMGGDVFIISIMMNLRNVHRQKSPNSAVLISQEYQKGKFFNAVRKKKRIKANFQNEYNSMLFELQNGTKFKVIQIAGFLARRIKSFVNLNQFVNQGDTIGLIKFGSQVTIIFDNSVSILAKVGQKVIDGETILAIKKNS